MTNKKGFTLLELLIVIAVIAILSVILIFVLNPAETLQKARDTQRMSDLATLKTAVGLYITSTSSPQLDGVSGTIQDKCLLGGGAKTIFLSAQDPLTSSTAAAGFTLVATSTSASSSLVNGTGWVPINLSSLTGGSPIGNMPVDPTNTSANGSSTVTTPTNSALMYRYACRKSPLQFEFSTRLESATYGPGGTDDRSSKDAGNNPRLFETGTDLTILPNSDNY